MKLPALLLMFLAFFGSKRSALADEDGEGLIDRGVKLMADGDPAAALAVFKRAQTLSPGPRAQGQVGLAEAALERWVEAEANIGAALAVEDHPWTRRNRRQLEAALAAVRAHLGMLHVSGSPRGAKIFIGGLARGVLPSPPLRLAAGTLELSVRAPGYLPVYDDIRVEPASLTRVVIHLSTEPPATVPKPPPLPPPDPARSTWFGTSLLVAGGAALAVGGYLLGADGKCADGGDARLCHTVRDTTGAGFAAGGLGVVAIGVGVFGLVSGRF
jgi:hypothetical protein